VGTKQLASTKVILEKPIFNVDISFDEDFQDNVTSVELRSVVTSNIPSSIESLQNLKSFSANVLGYKGNFTFLDQFKAIKNIELLNCAHLTKEQLEQLDNLEILHQIESLTLTFVPSDQCLYNILSNCTSLKTLTVDINTLRMLSLNKRKLKSHILLLNRLDQIKVLEEYEITQGFWSRFDKSPFIQGQFLGNYCGMGDFINLSALEYNNPFELPNTKQFKLANSYCESKKSLDYSA
jgi:hypothetical protein